MTESLLLAAIGGTAGLGLAYFGTAVAIGFAPSNIPRIGQTGVDLHVLVFTSAVTLLAGILFGLAPALSGARGQPSHSLKEAGTRISSGSTSLAVRHVLVGSQMALAVMMLVSAGLLLRSFVNVVRLDPGFQTAHVLSGYVMLADVEVRRTSETSGVLRRGLEAGSRPARRDVRGGLELHSV